MLKLGNTAINKFYLGATEINKLYYGSALVFEPTPTISLTPIMTNFRVGDTNKDRVYFDTPLGYPDGISTTGFSLINPDSGTNIVSTINKVSSTSGYFGLTESFNYWSNRIIKLDSGDGTIYDFEYHDVLNNITEPSAATIRYASQSGSGSQDGTSEANSWSYSQAGSNATSGMTVYVKAGSASSFVISNSGASATNPIKFIGYKTTPGDDPSFTFSKNITLSASEMPLITGSGTSGINFSSNDYIILKNFQATGHQFPIDFRNCDNVHLVNCYADEAGEAGFNSFTSSTGTKQRLTSCWSRNAQGYGYHCTGREHAYIDSYCCSNRAISMDYNFDFQGSSITRSGYHKMINIEIERDDLETHGQHGITLYGGKPIEHCLIDTALLNNVQQTLEARRSGTKYSVWRNIVCNSVNNTEMAGIMINSSSFNTFDNIRINGGNRAIKFYTAVGAGDSSATHKGEDNTIKNCVFNDVEKVIHNDYESGINYTMNRNKIINCTFDNFNFMYESSSPVTGNVGNEILGSIIQDVTSEHTGAYSVDVFSFSNSLFWNCGTWADSFIGSDDNFEINPQLDANYEPQATFTDIDIPKQTGVNYDKNEDERDDPTTVGAIKHADEVIATEPNPELVTDGGFDQGADFWDIGGGTSTISGGQATIATTGTFASLSQDDVMTEGNVYEVNFDVISTNGETLYTNLDEIAWDTSTTGSKTQIITAPEARLLFKRRVGSSTTNVTLDNISVKASTETPDLIPTYYVSESLGSDSNDGLTEQTAWETISKVEAESSNFVAGDVIAFKGGDTWIGERYYSATHPSGSESQPITYTSYGTGDKPVITMEVDQSARVWSDDGSNIWSMTENRQNRFFKNGVEMLKAISLAELQGGSNGTEYFANGTTAYVYSLTDPNLDTFSWSDENYFLYFDSTDYITLDGLDIRGGDSSSLQLRTNNDGWVLKNCSIGKNASGGIIIDNSINITIDNCVFDANYTVDMSNIPTGGSGVDARGCNDGISIYDTSSNIEIKNSTFKNWGHSAFVSDPSGVGNEVTNVSIHDNEFSAPDILWGRAIDYAEEFEDSEIYNNYIHDLGVQNQLGGSNNHFHHNIINNVNDSPLKTTQVGHGLSIGNYTSKNTNNIIENNLIMNCDGAGIFFEDYNSGTGEMSGNIIRNNIIQNCGLTNNNYGIQYDENVGDDIFDNYFHNNLVYSSATTSTFNYNNTTYTASNFNSQNVDFESNIDGDPLVDVEYYLSVGSPAINTGTPALSTEDYYGETMDLTTPDIGVTDNN